MKKELFDTIVNAQLSCCEAVLINKAREYATEDRLHNFKVAAELKHETTQEALLGMMAKHTISIYDMCQSKEVFPMDVWIEKITDHINYLILLRAVMTEDTQKRNREATHACQGN